MIKLQIHLALADPDQVAWSHDRAVTADQFLLPNVIQRTHYWWSSRPQAQLPVRATTAAEAWWWLCPWWQTDTLYSLAAPEGFSASGVGCVGGELCRHERRMSLRNFRLVGSPRQIEAGRPQGSSTFPPPRLPHAPRTSASNRQGLLYPVLRTPDVIQTNTVDSTMCFVSIANLERLTSCVLYDTTGPGTSE
jgi:hypothetical protein